MKKIKISALALLFLGGMATNNAYSQKKAYFNLNLGYNFSLASEYIGTNFISSYSPEAGEDSQYGEAVYGSYGKGMSFGVAFGYMFGDNIGAELGVSKLIGVATKLTYEGKETSSTNTSTTNYTYKVSGNMLQLNPSIIISAGKTEGLNPYAKFGLVIGKGSINYEGENITTNTSSVESAETWKRKMDGGTALGFSAAIGTNYSFNEKMSLFGELNMINMSYAPSKSELTTFNIDGIDELASMTTSQKETEFVDSMNYSSSDIYDDSKPSQQLKTPYSFGSLGIKIGFRYSF